MRSHTYLHQYLSQLSHRQNSYFVYLISPIWSPLGVMCRDFVSVATAKSTFKLVIGKCSKSDILNLGYMNYGSLWINNALVKMLLGCTLCRIVICTSITQRLIVVGAISWWGGILIVWCICYRCIISRMKNVWSHLTWYIRNRTLIANC